MSLKCRYIDNRLDMFHVLICTITTPYSLASCLIWFSSLHTCFPLTSPRFFMHYPWCNTLALRTLNCRTNTCRNHGYNAVADDSCAGSHLLSWNRHPLATKKVRKVEKVKILGPYVPYGLFQTKGEMCTKFGSDWFKNVNLYKVQPNKQTHKETNKNKKKL